MDLDELRDASEPRPATGPSRRRRRSAARVAARSGRRRRRRIGVSLVAVAAAVALVVGTVAVVEQPERPQDRRHPAEHGAAAIRRAAVTPRRSAGVRRCDSARSSCLAGTRTQSSRPPGTTRGSGTDTGWSEVHPAASRRRARRRGDGLRPATQTNIVMFGGLTLGSTTQTRAHRHVDLRRQHVDATAPGPRSAVEQWNGDELRPEIAVGPHAHAALGSSGHHGDGGRIRAGPGAVRHLALDRLRLAPSSPRRTAPLFFTSPDTWSTAPQVTPLANGAGLLFYSWALPESDLGTCPAPGTACEPLPDPDGTRYSQTWTWDGTTWTERHPTARRKTAKSWRRPARRQHRPSSVPTA